MKHFSFLFFYPIDVRVANGNIISLFAFRKFCYRFFNKFVSPYNLEEQLRFSAKITKCFSKIQ